MSKITRLSSDHHIRYIVSHLQERKGACRPSIVFTILSYCHPKFTMSGCILATYPLCC